MHRSLRALVSRGRSSEQRDEVAVLGAGKNLAREARADVLGAIAHTRGSDY